ncbi:bifunctional hexulose-6-phosphate synthase/ribonuclease regulator [Methanophagales archaeon]|nr:MAG: bifunctional hexulose-6-phosphate synthase/ribonuclease regulator [Methanophagales archaeon]RLG35255.1 MAG: bifunctional hexulose-6-phosphate synthase/ribonuclease regulator [Methanosarcinales archaeon]
MEKKKERGILQVALDVLELERAIEIGKESLEGGADWLEAGTPLIKSEGMNAIRTLKEVFPGVKIVADMKTMDTGAIEVEMAAKSGASVVSILAVADNAVIEEAVKSARKYGVAIMVDIMNVEEPVRRAEEMEELSVDYVCVHVGIDQQMRGMNTLDLLEKVSATIDTPLAVAGGVDAEMASEAVNLGAEIVIVGGNITRSAKVRESTIKIRKSMDLRMTEEKEKGERKGKRTLDEQIFELFMQVSTPNISDAMHRKGVMRDIKPLFEDIKLVGKAVTVQTFEGDWAKPVEATDVAKEGDVIVVYAGSKDVAPWGELASWSCKQKGIAGIVIDGAVRDVEEIRRLRFPVFAKFVVPNAGEPKGFGELNAEIKCGGQEVKPGDWIIGDDNGVVVVPKEHAYEIARRAKEVWKNEERVRAEIKKGRTLSQVLDLYKWEKR